MENPKLHLVNRLLEYRKKKRRELGAISKSSPVNRYCKKGNSNLFEKGTEFESFVVKLFNPEYFTLIEWRSDKSIDGIFPIMSKFPDLEFYFESKTENLQFAVECKWREHFYQEGIELDKFQLENYRHYEQVMQTPTFIVIGIGDTPSHPRNVYLLPLREITKEHLHEYELEVYLRRQAYDKIFLDCQRLILK